MLQYPALAAASGPSPKHMQNTNHYYITMTSAPIRSVNKSNFWD